MKWHLLDSIIDMRIFGDSKVYKGNQNDKLRNTYIILLPYYNIVIQYIYSIIEINSQEEQITQLKVNKQMLIEHKQYLSILDQIAYLKDQNKVLCQENTLLTQELVTERQRRRLYQQTEKQNIILIKKLHQQLLSHQEDTTKQIIGNMSKVDQERKQYLQKKFADLENSSLTKLKDLEVKNVKNRLDFFEVNQFTQKIKKIYKNCQGKQQKSRKQPSFVDILKWLKSMPNVSVHLPKQTLTSYTSTNNLNKSSVKQSGVKQSSTKKSLKRQNSCVKLQEKQNNVLQSSSIANQ